MATPDNTALTSLGDDWIADYGTASLTIYDAGDVALVTHTLTGFVNVNGVLTANAIATETIANTGVASYAEVSAVAGVYTLTVGTSGTDVIIDDTSLVAGGDHTVNSMVVTFS